MATIALYANKVNNMPFQLQAARLAVWDLYGELGKVYRKAVNIESGVCDVSEVISSISATTQTQEKKVEALQEFYDEVIDFIDDVERIDDDVADEVNSSKDDFYDKYSYLKPDCEKSGWEKFCDGCKAVGQWCAEHWKVIVTAVLVVAAVVAISIISCGTLTGPMAVLLGAMAKGVLIGTVVGGLSGGVVNAFTGGSFWEGVEDGAFGGAISGLISGGAGAWLSHGMTISQGVGLMARTTFTQLATWQSVAISAFSEGFSSLLGSLGDIAIAGKNLSFGEVMFDTVISAALGGVGEWGASKFLPDIKIEGIHSGRNSWQAIWKSSVTKTLRYEIKISFKNFMKGFGADFLGDGFKHLVEFGKGFVSKGLSALNGMVGDLVGSGA